MGAGAEGMTTVAVLRQILTQEPQALLGGFEATAWGYFVQGARGPGAPAGGGANGSSLCMWVHSLPG